MVEPEKPFACTIPSCGMTFTNEDHLTVHTKKHDMCLQLGLEQKAAFVADQTPTPTRFIRNCEEVGLFQDLQNVNPFEEGFKRATETNRLGLLPLDSSLPPSTTDDLHTPQMVFPILDNADSTLYTSNNKKNITISRSSSDESGTIKEYETTTISKLTNEVTTISRVVNKHDSLDRTHAVDDVLVKTGEQITHTDVHNETSVSYTNNVIKIHNNIEIRKDNHVNVESVKNVPVIVDAVKDAPKDVAPKSQIEIKLPPIMSQKSIDFVVDSLTSECQNIKTPEVRIRNRKVNKSKVTPPPIVTDSTNEAKSMDDYEVIIKLPGGKHVRMKAVDDAPETAKIDTNTKEKLKLAINKKVSQKNAVLQIPNITTPIQGILPVSTGTLIPITIVNPTQFVQKIPIAPFNPTVRPSQEFKKTVKRKSVHKDANNIVSNYSVKIVNNDGISDTVNGNDEDDCVIVEDVEVAPKKKTKEDLDSRVEASRRYRVKLKESMRKQVDEIQHLKEENQRLTAESAVLKLLITQHMRKCPNADDLRRTQEKLSLSGPGVRSRFS